MFCHCSNPLTLTFGKVFVNKDLSMEILLPHSVRLPYFGRNVGIGGGGTKMKSGPTDCCQWGCVKRNKSAIKYKAKMLLWRQIKSSQSRSLVLSFFFISCIAALPTFSTSSRCAIAYCGLLLRGDNAWFKQFETRSTRYKVFAGVEIIGKFSSDSVSMILLFTFSIGLFSVYSHNRRLVVIRSHRFEMYGLMKIWIHSISTSKLIMTWFDWASKLIQVSRIQGSFGSVQMVTKIVSCLHSSSSISIFLSFLSWTLLQRGKEVYRHRDCNFYILWWLFCPHSYSHTQ